MNVFDEEIGALTSQEQAAKLSVLAQAGVTLRELRQMQQYPRLRVLSEDGTCRELN